MKNFEQRIETLWTNAREIDLSSPFVYYIRISQPGGTEYRYVGRARNLSRLKEYRRNMNKIVQGRPRGKRQRYRAIHFVMFTALMQGWEMDFFPYEACAYENLNSVEQRLKTKLKCNLNARGTWPVERVGSLNVENFL